MGDISYDDVEYSIRLSMNDWCRLMKFRRKQREEIKAQALDELIPLHSSDNKCDCIKCQIAKNIESVSIDRLFSNSSATLSGSEG